MTKPEQTEEEELILGILASIAEAGRQDELPGMLAGMVMAVAGITENPQTFIDEHIDMVESARGIFSPQ